MSVQNLILEDIDTLEANRNLHLTEENTDYLSALIRLENYSSKKFGEESSMTQDLERLKNPDFNDDGVFNRLRSYLGE